MESITLKEIAGHLPDIEILITNYKCDYVGIEKAKVNGYYLINNDIYSTYVGGSTGKKLGTDCKLILNNLSMLTQDENFEMYLDLCDCLEMVRCDSLIEALQNNSYYAIDIQKHKLLEEWMYKNHFDWKYNLLGRGLAIDKSKM